MEIWAVVNVETSGCGCLPDRRPQILYERHVFHALTNGRFDDGDISDPTSGGYGPPGAHQYDRLARAIQLGPVGGIAGPHTRRAVALFRTENRLTETGGVDDALLERLTPA